MPSPRMQMGTRVCSCVRVRSRAGADDALTRGMCASAMRSLRNAIDGTRTDIVYRYMMHACIYTHARLARGTDRRCGPASHTRPRAASVRVRGRLGAHTSAPACASAFRRRPPRVARLAGVLWCVKVQREHRRVEHRGRNRLGLCMRRPLSPGGAPAHAGRARRVVDTARAFVRGGTADARAHRRIHTYI